MKPLNVYLDELNSNSKNYTVRVKVIEKRCPKTSPNKRPYQSLLLQDDKGISMRGALFAEQLDVYEDALKRNKVYEITNASISPLNPEWKTSPADLDYQMTFGRRTIIMPVDSDDDPTNIDYQPVSRLPRSSDYTEMFDTVSCPNIYSYSNKLWSLAISICLISITDIVGVVLFVEDQPRKITTNNKRESIVREILLIYHSTPQPLSISVWDELAEDDCTMLLPELGKFRTVGLTALRVSKHKGFSMSTSTSTIIIHSHVGEKADALITWMKTHHTTLSQLQARLFQVRLPMSAQRTTNILAIRARKQNQPCRTKDTDEAYGSSIGFDRPPVEARTPWTPQITFNCDISDGTGKLPMTAFTSTSEKLFKLSATDIFHMKHSNDDQAFSTVQELLRHTPFKVQVGPATSLSVNNILQWEVKQVLIDDEDDSTEGNLTSVEEALPATQAANDAHVSKSNPDVPTAQIIASNTTTPVTNMPVIVSNQPVTLGAEPAVTKVAEDK